MAFKLQKKTRPWGLLKESKVLPKKSQNRIWQSLQLSQLCKILISHFFFKCVIFLKLLLSSCTSKEAV